MEQRIYHGPIKPGALAQALVNEWDRGPTIAQAFSDGDQQIVQIGQREGGLFSDEPHQAITLGIESFEDGVRVTMGQQRWYKDGGVQIFAGGLIGLFPFFFAFPLGQLLGGGEIDQSLPGRIWHSIDRYTAGAGAATGETRRLPTVTCPECGVANPQGAERCSACGASLSQMPNCPNCGHTNPPCANFCNRCGTQLRSVA